MTSHTQAIDLKNCPFCGGLAQMSTNSGSVYWIECVKCKACSKLSYSCGEDCRPMLIEAWNRRTTATIEAPTSEPMRGASIDTPAYRNLMWLHHQDPLNVATFDALIAHINAWHARQSASVEGARQFLLPDDLASLKRFFECCDDPDSGGHDVPKAAMARLREIGVVAYKNFGRHEITSFGDFVLGHTDGEDFHLPLKTYAEYCEESRVRAAQSDGGDLSPAITAMTKEPT